MTKRIITIVCEVDQPEANWIWEQHMSVTGIPVHGVIRVESIFDGDIIQKRDDLENAINKIQEIICSRDSSFNQIEKIIEIIELTDNKN